jgi:ADP-ribose pyrophosphatase
MIERPDQEGTLREFDRDVLRSGNVVGVLPVDPRSREVVLIRQFRLGAHLATARGMMVEIPAGTVDPGETIERAARRECLEETGLEPVRLSRLFGFLPAPALSDEFMTLFIALVDAAQAPERGGAGHEGEDLEVVRCTIDSATHLIERDELHSGPTVIALQWLELHKHMLRSLFGE